VLGVNRDVGTTALFKRINTFLNYLMSYDKFFSYFKNFHCLFTGLIITLNLNMKEKEESNQKIPFQKLSV